MFSSLGDELPLKADLRPMMLTLSGEPHNMPEAYSVTPVKSK